MQATKANFKVFGEWRPSSLLRKSFLRPLKLSIDTKDVGCDRLSWITLWFTKGELNDGFIQITAILSYQIFACLLFFTTTKGVGTTKCLPLFFRVSKYFEDFTNSGDKLSIWSEDFRSKSSITIKLRSVATVTQSRLKDGAANCVHPPKRVDSALFNSEKIVRVPMRVKIILKLAPYSTWLHVKCCNN